jgi:hypothetical protein
MIIIFNNKKMSNNVKQNLYLNKLVIDLTKNDDSLLLAGGLQPPKRVEDKPEVYLQKDYRNLTLEEDGLQFIEIKPYCKGCYPIFQCNQLAHMDYGGCLFYQEE